MQADSGGLADITLTFVQDAVTAEQTSLGRRVESLLAWLGGAEAGTGGGRDDEASDELTQQMDLCKAS